MSQSSSTLDRRLGPLDAAAIIVANVIGGGILFTPPQVAAAVPNPFWFLATWLAGGALAFAGAMAYAELAALRPRAGGEYVYLREAYGPLAGFHDRMDVVRGRFRRSDGGERDLSDRVCSIASFRASPIRRRFLSFRCRTRR